ncbi:hypothetical protein DO73_4977 [Burkholderia pseudomallei]|nr:hypothetical protein DO73_4977 [Burkholderia pseudomallei]
MYVAPAYPAYYYPAPSLSLNFGYWSGGGRGYWRHH